MSEGLRFEGEISAAVVEVIAARAAELLGERVAPNRGYLDVQGAADFLACPRSRICALVSTGRLPHYRDGSRLLFDREELRQFVRDGGARRP